MQQPSQHQHGHVFLKDIRPSAQNNLNTTFIFLEKGSPTRGDATGQLLSINLVADQTASAHLQLWGNECEAFQPGDIVRLTNGLFSFNKAHGFALRAGKKGRIEKIGEFTMVFVENPNISKLQWLQDPSNPSVWTPVGLNNQQLPQGFHGSLNPNISKLQWLQDPSYPSVWTPVGQQLPQGFHGSLVGSAPPSSHRSAHHD